jgi:hypothetical protein
VRKRRKHQLRASERRVVVRDEAHFSPAETCALAAALIRSREHELETRVASDDATQLAPGVSTRTEYSNRNSMHDECILLHSPDVNRVGMQRRHRETVACHVLPLRRLAW